MYFFEKTIAASALAALLLSAAASPALATPNFPACVAVELDLGAAPQCSLCHAGTPKLGTVTTPFGTSMRGRGLAPHDEQSLVNALMALEGEGTDSDDDGVGDIEELRQGADPNAAEGGEGGEAVIVPEYGCSVGSRGGLTQGAGPSAVALVALVAVLALAGFARRIAPRRGRQ